MWSNERIIGRTCDIVWNTPLVLPDEDQVAVLALARSSSQIEVGHIEEIVPPPTKLHVRCSIYGKLIFDELKPSVTLGELKQLIVDRLVLQPDRLVRLSHWGIELQDDRCTLQDLKLKNGCTLDMRTSLSYGPRPEAQGLERVRVVSTALETRTVAVSPATTGLDLKNAIMKLLLCGDHEWYDKLGNRTAVLGGTVLALAKMAADDKAGTVAMSQGEEFVTSQPFVGEMGKGKPLSVVRASKGGAPVLVNDLNLVMLHLPPEKQRLTFHSSDVRDASLLCELGIRTDDTIMLEFESPCAPAVLQLLRAPVVPKEGKKKGGKGKKKK